MLAACEQSPPDDIPDLRDQAELVAAPAEQNVPAEMLPLEQGTIQEAAHCSVTGESANLLTFDCASGEDCTAAAMHDAPRALTQLLIERSLKAVDVQTISRRGSDCGILVLVEPK